MSPLQPGVSCGCQGCVLWQICKDTRTTFDPITDFDRDAGIGIKQHVSPRSKFDQAHALSSLKQVPGFGSKHNAPGQQARDLFEHDALSLTFYVHDVLLILLRAIRATRIEKLSALIMYVTDYACDRRPVDMYIENAQKNADAGPFAAVSVYDRNVS